MSDLVRLSLAEAHALCVAALTASDTAPENAESVAAALVSAEASGQGGHGLSRIPSYTGQSKSGKVNGRAIPVLHEIRPAVIRINAGNGFAFPAFDRALPELAVRAATHGLALATIAHSHHFGVAGWHCERLAEQGCIVFVYGNAPKALAPWGATEPVLGTSPIAFAAPGPDAPIVIDMATTAVARGKILAAREIGEPIPEGWALGPDGRPTTDAATALQGTVAPMAGAKGAALSLMVEIMSACLTGAALAAEASGLFDPEGPPPDLGQTVIAIDASLVSGGMFATRMADLVSIYDKLEGARLPGTRRLAEREKAAREGLHLKTALIEQIRGIAGT